MERMVRRYLHSDAVVIHPASLRESTDMLQTARHMGPSPATDPVRTALLIASLCATVAVGCVAFKAFFSSNQEQGISIQAPR